MSKIGKISPATASPNRSSKQNVQPWFRRSYSGIKRGMYGLYISKKEGDFKTELKLQGHTLDQGQTMHLMVAAKHCYFQLSVLLPKAKCSWKWLCLYLSHLWNFAWTTCESRFIQNDNFIPEHQNCEQKSLSIDSTLGTAIHGKEAEQHIIAVTSELGTMIFTCGHCQSTVFFWKTGEWHNSLHGI